MASHEYAHPRLCDGQPCAHTTLGLVIYGECSSSEMASHENAHPQLCNGHPCAHTTLGPSSFMVSAPAQKWQATKMPTRICVTSLTERLRYGTWRIHAAVVTRHWKRRASHSQALELGTSRRPSKSQLLSSTL
eukprot:1158636-Pelagomonas_calceolata.AAC.4